MSKKNAYFNLQIHSGGTYLQVYDAVDGGKPITAEAVLHYFKLIHFTDYDLEDLTVKLAQSGKNNLIKLTGKKIAPVDECLSVEITCSEQEAVVTFYAPSNGGKTMSKEDIVESLHHSHVTFGIDHKLINAWVLNRVYNTEFAIARAKAPVQGSNGRVIYCFNTKPTAQPRIHEDGTVDYRQLDNIEHVKAGDKLAYLEKAVEGKAGMLVTGTVIPPAKIKTPRLKHGRNISVSEDGTAMYAEVPGHVYLVEDKVFVSNIYEVLADVDASTGNIDYDGDIHVKGTVRSGFVLNATGQIYVEGVVEGANLFADGPIIIKGGIQGMTKANIISHSNVTAKFIENATVQSSGNVMTEAIMHSNVSASGKVIVEGKKGLIVGGEVEAGEHVKFKVAGSPMSAFTSIKVGIDPEIVKDYRKKEKQVAIAEAEFTKLSEVIAAYRSKLKEGLNLNPKQIQTIKQIAVRVKELDKNLPIMRSYRDELGDLIVSSNNGKVVVEDKVYPRVKIEIANAILIVKSETHYCTFVKDGIDVVSRPL